MVLGRILKREPSVRVFSVSAFAAKLLEEALSEATRIDLLARNIHEECLTIEDMLTIIQGFNMEVYKTLLARTDNPLDAEQKKEMQENRKSAEKVINSYLDKVFKKIIAGENIWQGTGGNDDEA